MQPLGPRPQCPPLRTSLGLMEAPKRLDSVVGGRGGRLPAAEPLIFDVRRAQATRTDLVTSACDVITVTHAHPCTVCATTPPQISEEFKGCR